MSDHFYSYPNRTLCDVLSELRKCHETRNYAMMPSLVEEVQTLANRMESALADKEDVRTWSEKRSKLKEEIRKLIAERDALKPKS